MWASQLRRFVRPANSFSGLQNCIPRTLLTKQSPSVGTTNTHHYVSPFKQFPLHGGFSGSFFRMQRRGFLSSLRPHSSQGPSSGSPFSSSHQKSQFSTVQLATDRIRNFLSRLDYTNVSKNDVRSEMSQVLNILSSAPPAESPNASYASAYSRDGIEASGKGTMQEPLHVITARKRSFFDTLLSLAGFFLTLAIVYMLFFRGSSGILGEEFGSTFEEFDANGRRPPKRMRVGPILVEEERPNQDQPKKTTFEDVRGCQEAKEELADVIDYLQHPEKYEDIGVALPKGVLLVGPPGCGKTLLARALAGEAGVPFLTTDGSSFDQMFVGLGSKRVRSLFQRAREIAPCIVFIDEIDAVASRREEPMNKTRATLNQLLVEMDGFKQTAGVVVVGATNLPSMLDPALIRPGRFDRRVQVNLPDRQARKDILTLYLEEHMEPSVDLEQLATDTPGFSGAELRNMVNIAGIDCVKEGKDRITMDSLVNAKETVMMGRAKKSMILTEATRNICAFHEAGHAIVALLSGHADTIYKATLVPRGDALGMVFLSPTDDMMTSKAKLLARMDVAMGGRAAEEIVFGPDEITQGASSDFQSATGIAESMVKNLGMSDQVGRVFYRDESLEKLSTSKRALIDSEISRLLDESYTRASTLLKNNQKALDALAHALLEKETLTLDEIKEIVSKAGTLVPADK